MKRTFSIILSGIASLVLLTSCGEAFNAERALYGAVGAAQALSITDEQVREYVHQYITQLDAQSAVLPENDAYTLRLRKLTSGLTQVDGVPLNFKVYKTSDINAFACGDGSIRVYSGLMDVMDDEELTAIIGHELGHVRHKDTKKAIKNAYVASAARDILSSAGSYGAMASALLGDVGESLVSAQFSQSQEYKADEHGCQFAIERGVSPYSMYNALNKLNQLSDGSEGSVIAHMFADHPKTEKRMEKMKKMADNYVAKSSK